MSDPAQTHTPDGEPKKGDVIAGKFLVERVLAAGGMGVVVEATHLTLSRRVAVKVMLPVALELPNAVERFQREAQAAAGIQNEHVVRILDVGTQDNGSPYMVMEYLAGTDLGDLVGPDKALSVEVSVDYVLQACEGMAEAHKRGIVHRDLKPGNLFLVKRADGTPCIKVLDFGISKFSGRDEMGREQGGLTSTRAMMGSPFYMSPEQVRSAKNVDRRTDIWSLGVILHELLVGTPPFEGETAGAVCAMVAADPPVPLTWVRPDAPPELEAVILRCLEKEPERRFQDVRELAVALKPFASKAGLVSIENVTKALTDGTPMPTLFAAPVKLQPPPGARPVVKTTVESATAREIAGDHPSPSPRPVAQFAPPEEDASADVVPMKKTRRSGLALLLIFGLVGWGAWTLRGRIVNSAVGYFVAAPSATTSPPADSMDAARIATSFEPLDAGVTTSVLMPVDIVDSSVDASVDAESDADEGPDDAGSTLVVARGPATHPAITGRPPPKPGPKGGHHHPGRPPKR